MLNTQTQYTDPIHGSIQYPIHCSMQYPIHGSIQDAIHGSVQEPIHRLNTWPDRGGKLTFYSGRHTGRFSYPGRCSAVVYHCTERRTGQWQAPCERERTGVQNGGRSCPTRRARRRRIRRLTWTDYSGCTAIPG